MGVVVKKGKIVSLAKDSSAARNGLLTHHYICEVNGQNVIGMKVGTQPCPHSVAAGCEVLPCGLLQGLFGCKLQDLKTRSHQGAATLREVWVGEAGLSHHRILALSRVGFAQLCAQNTPGDALCQGSG